MSLEFADGFDHYNQNSSFIGRKWDTVSGAVQAFGSGRYGSGLAWNSWNNAVAIRKTLTSVATRIVGFAAYFGGSVASGTICAFQDSGSTQTDLRVNSSGNLYITRNGTTLATSASAVVANTWYYIELSVTIGSSTGAYTLKVTSGTVSTWLTATSVNTQATGNATSNQIWLSLNGLSGNPGLIDDVYILNTSGSVNNSFLGECRIYTSLPNGDDTAATGTNLLWTPSTGSTHYNLVNENPPNDDTNYVGSNTAGQIDTYKYAAIAPVGGIAAVVFNMMARRDDTGVRQIAAAYRGGSTNYQGTGVYPTVSYMDYQQIWETDPATSAPWTASGVNAGEFGVDLVA
jgi:hypothetical protein